MDKENIAITVYSIIWLLASWDFCKEMLKKKYPSIQIEAAYSLPRLYLSQVGKPLVGPFESLEEVLDKVEEINHNSGN